MFEMVVHHSIWSDKSSQVSDAKLEEPPIVQSGSLEHAVGASDGWIVGSEDGCVLDDDDGSVLPLTVGFDECVNVGS